MEHQHFTLILALLTVENEFVNAAKADQAQHIAPVGAVPDGGDERPIDHAAQDPERQPQANQRQNRIGDARKQVCPRPPDHANRAARRPDIDCRLGRRCCAGHRYLSTSAMRVLNQFMNSDVARLSVR